MRKYILSLAAMVMLLSPMTCFASENSSVLPYSGNFSEQDEYADAVYDSEHSNVNDISNEVVWTLEDTKNILETDWKSLSDEELTDAINHSSDQQAAKFLDGLTEEEFYSVIERETPLKYPVYRFTDLDEYEMTENGLEQKQKKEVLAEHYYEYLQSYLVDPLSWSDSTGNYEGTASGYFYFKIKQDGTTVTNLTVKVSNVTAGGSVSGKYTISGTYGTWNTSSVKSEKESHVWAGIVLNGSYTKPAHYYTLWSSAGHGLGRYDPWNANYTSYTLDYTHSASNTTDNVRIQVNGCNIGLVAGYTGYHATGTISLVKYNNALNINPNGGNHEGHTSTYQLSNKVCQGTTTVSDPTREGYEFTGWTVSNGTGAGGSLSGGVFTHCNKGAVFSTDTDVYSNTTVTTTLTANWVAKNYPYEVRYYKQLPDGSYPDNPDEVETGEAGNGSRFTGPLKSYTGYLTPDAQTITIGKGPNGVSYYYQKAVFDLTVDPNGGTWEGKNIPTALTIETGQSRIISDPVAPAGANVTLVYHDDAGKVVTTSAIKEFSHWTKTGGGEFNAATKTFTSRNGNATLTANYIGGKITLPVPPEREHYTFIGWDRNPDIDPDIQSPDYRGGETIDVSADMELHGIWKVDFELRAAIERILLPHDPVFENGEKGVLKIELVGFVNRVDVTFPYELTRYDDTLSQSYTLDPKLTDNVTQEFYIPLYSEQGTYRVTVTAYNEEGDSLTVYPGLAITGTILDDFRTRLR